MLTPIAHIGQPQREEPAESIILAHTANCQLQSIGFSGMEGIHSIALRRALKKV
jgi:hypothetical protein